MAKLYGGLEFREFRGQSFVWRSPKRRCEMKRLKKFGGNIEMIAVNDDTGATKKKDEGTDQGDTGGSGSGTNNDQ